MGSGPEAVKERSTQQGSRNPSPALIDLTREFTGHQGSDGFHQVPAMPARLPRRRDLPLLPPRAAPRLRAGPGRRVSAPVARRHAARPARPPGPGRATHVLLHFGQVLLGQGRRGGLHGGGGGRRSFRVRARAAPPRPGWGLRPPEEGWGGEAERVGGRLPPRKQGDRGSNKRFRLCLRADGGADLRV